MAVSRSALKVPVLYQDNDVIVINKPADLVVYSPDGNTQPSVLDQFRSQIKITGSRGGVVHRLDKFTSGVMILAKTEAAQEYLMSQFKARKVQKTYQALIHGHMKHQNARIELPLSRDRAQYTKMRIDPAGKMGVMEYKLLSRFASHDLLEINLLTGRMHQIRVQLSHLGHSVVGDVVYGQKSDASRLSRPFLHSQTLSLKLPDGETKAFTAPLPEELQAFLQQLN